MKKWLAGLIAGALVCTALPVYAAEDAEPSDEEAAGSETEDSSLLSESLCLEESEAGEDLSDSDGWSIAAEQAQIPMTMAASSSGNVVVVLDPGHDSTHTGASYGGLHEETLNLKIAEYCREELEEYSGVTVYMTRTTAACPYPGGSNTDDLAGRVNYAANVGATVYVSLHLNANTNTSASGAQVYCPNSNYRPSISTEGFALANSIMTQLNALGLSNRGVYSVDSQSGTTYPDGSLADYYAVIRRSKLAGFPGIIVEHAFMSNTSDLNTYLSSDASLKRLGVADATGIANYFNLSKAPAGTLEKLNGVWTYFVGDEPDYTYTGLASNEYGWWYVKNGVVDFSYTGFVENSYGKWYCENGEVTFHSNGVIKDTTGAIGAQGTWYYVVNSEVQTSYTGVADFANENGWWYIKNGVVDFSANTVAKNKNGWWYVKGGKVDFSYTGFAENSNGKWYCENGKVNFDVTGLIKDTAGAIGAKGTWYYVINSEVQTSYTGVADFANENGWWYIKNGAVDFSANTVAKNKNGWWYVKGGKVDFSYTGFAENNNGKWYCENGKVNFNVTGLIKDIAGAIGAKGTWYYVIGSQVQTSYTGVADFANENGWWYIKNGAVDFSANTVAKNKNGWWYVTGGKVRFGFTGLANYKNAYGWWYIKNGKVDFSHTGVDENYYGWWYVAKGKVDFSYTGIAQNSNGWWYIKNGALDFTFSGNIQVSGNTCQVRNGRVVQRVEATS